MGDRAVISNRTKNLGVYLHWYGYREFVESVLAYCNAKQYRSPDVDDEYGWARLCQVLGNTLGGNLSLGVGNFSKMDTDNWDNGTYIIDGWDIKERLYQHYQDEKMKDSMFENLKYINDKQPKEEQLKEEELRVFAELWEIKHIDRLNDERKSYIEEKIKMQKQEEKEKQSTENEQKVEKINDEKEQNTTLSDKKDDVMSKKDINEIIRDFEKDTQKPTRENEVKEKKISYESINNYKGGKEIDR